MCLQSKQKEADEVKKRFAGEYRSDHIALLRAFRVCIDATSVYNYTEVLHTYIVGMGGSKATR